MYCVCVSIHVKSEHVAEFIEATLDNARNTRQEPGNLRFDVLRHEDDSNRFFLYEVYRDKIDLVRHQETEHYARWRDAVKDWMAENRVGVKYIPIFYGDIPTSR